MTEDSTDWGRPQSSEAAADTAPETGAAPPDVAAMSFEQALAELESIVQDLERGQLDLEAAIQAYERGTQLKQHCETKLREAQLRVERITLGEDGTARATPFDAG